MRVWHDQNPRQKAQGALGHMLYTVALNVVEDCSERTLDEEREVLEQRLAMVNDRLDAKRRAQRMVFDGVEIPARQQHNPCMQGALAQHEALPRLPNSTKEAAKATDNTTATNTGGPLHPYAQACDATSAGDPLARNFAYGSGRKPQGTADPAQRKEPIYTHVAPVTDTAADERIFKRTLRDMQITMSTAELLSMSPLVWRMVHEVTTAKRVAAKAEPTAQSGRATAPRSDGASREGTSNTAPRKMCSRLPVQQAYMTDCPEEDGPTIATTNPDFETYNVLRSPKDVEEGWEDAEDLPRGVYCMRPDQDFRDGSALSGLDIVVADKAYKLCTIFVWVNNSDQPTKCVLDLGSQIIAISKKKVHEL